MGIAATLWTSLKADYLGVSVLVQVDGVLFDYAVI
jgi:hypothetical protein